MIEALKGLDPSFAAQRARVHAAMAFDPKLFYTAGTNLKGVHGKGGALFAKESFGLPMRQFEGIHGRTIAVPTRTGPPITTLPAEEIRQSLIRYRNTLQANPDKTALLPPIGMGNAGIAPDKMLGMMDDAGLMQMENQIVPTSEMVLKGFPETAARLHLIEGMRKAQVKTELFPWARYAKGKPNFEVTTHGGKGKEFSAFNARFKKDQYTETVNISKGNSVEEVYQTEVKGYASWRDGKGKPTRNGQTREELYEDYKELWRIWYRENPSKIRELAKHAEGKVITDKFATTEINQARVHSELLTELHGKGWLAKPQRGTMPATKKSLVNTSFVGPMNFPIMGAKTIKSRTTFDAITAGERTMTTRKVGQGWENRKVGEVFPITGKGNQQQLIQITDDPVMYTVTGKESQAFLNRWAELEGHGPEQFNRLFTQGQKITMVKYRPIRTQNLKFISGGQIGADRIGLEKAKEWGIATGGTAPKGFKIDRGHDTSLRRFGLKEHPSADYPPRTKLNVENSDGTLIISTQNRASSGSKLTERYAREGNKPLLINPRSADEIHQWMVSNNIQTLNIAGNRKIYVDNPIWGYLEEAIKPLM